MVAFVVLLVLVIYFARKRLRKYSQKSDMGKNIGSPRYSQDLKPANISALHEIDNNSLYLHRELPDSGKVELLDGNSPSGYELPDSGKVELLDGNSPSGSGNEISEMPQSPTPVPLCELGTRHTSIAASTLHRQSDRNKNAIFVETGISRESNESSEGLKESPCVETIISSSPKQKSLNLDRPLPTPPERTPEYLNRALPSIPSSENTQSSPTKSSTSSPFSATNGIHSQSSRTSITISESESVPPDTALDMIWQDYDMSWESHRRPEPSVLSTCSTDIKIMMQPEVTEMQMREHPSMSSLSTDVELRVPPGTPKSQILSSAGGRKGERSPRANFF